LHTQTQKERELYLLGLFCSKAQLQKSFLCKSSQYEIFTRSINLDRHRIGKGTMVKLICTSEYDKHCKKKYIKDVPKNIINVLYRIVQNPMAIF
jgi:hypothetical protein